MNDRRKKILEQDYVNSDYLGDLLQDSVDVDEYDQSFDAGMGGVQVAGVDRLSLPLERSPSSATDEELTMPLPPRKAIKLPVASGKTMRESQAIGETKTPSGKYDLMTKPEEAMSQGQVEQGLRERQLQYEAGRGLLENYERIKKEREGGDPESVSLDSLRDKLLKTLEENEARRNAPVDPADPISAMLLGLGGGVAGAFSGQPNTGHLIAGNALKARDDAMARRAKIIDSTPEVKGILAAMKMKEDRAKGRDTREMNYEKLIVDNLSKLSQAGGEIGDEARKTQEMLINARKSGAQLEIEKYKAQMEKLKEKVGQREKDYDYVKEFGKKATEMGLPTIRAEFNNIGKYLGVPMYKLSKNPGENKKMAEQLGVNLGVPSQSIFGKIELASLPKEKKDKLTALRGSIAASVAMLRKSISGASLTEGEAAAFMERLNQGMFNSTEDALSGLARLYQTANAERHTIQSTYSKDKEVGKMIEERYPEFVDKNWYSPSEVEKVERPTTDDLQKIRLEHSKMKQKKAIKPGAGKGR